MQVRKVGKRRWMLALDRGEELHSTVGSFLEEQEVRGGVIIGLGALRDITLAWYDVENREYLKRTFDEPMELGNLVGSIGMLEGKPYLHAHATVSGPELIAFSGHLLRAEVAVTAEILILDFGEELPRAQDEELGLALFALAAEEEDEDEGEELGKGKGKGKGREQG